MCQKDPQLRTTSFLDVEKEIRNNKFFEIDFEEGEQQHYREFAAAMARHITKIENGSKYRDDIEEIETELEDVYRSFMLEEDAPDAGTITRCFIAGPYYYRKKGFRVYVVKDFLRLLKGATLEKKRIILANLQTRLDAIDRYSLTEPDDDEIPF